MGSPAANRRLEHAAPAQPDVSPSSEGRLLAALAETESRLGECESAWKTVVRELDATRRELTVATAQLQRTRSRAALQSRGEDEEAGTPRRPAPVRSEEARHARLLQEFEARLREAEARRVALHGETEQLRHRKQEVLRQFSAPARSAYETAVQAGRVPAITMVVDGVCSGCSCPQPAPSAEAVVRGAVVVCQGCGCLLRPTEAT